MRKLASIQKILDIQPIPDADAILKAKINDWWVVIAKADNYNVGDFVIYCEVDSWIPTEIAPFLTKTVEPRVYEGIKGERLRTVKLRGQISQGLILPLSVLPDSYDTHISQIGDDASGLLGIVKYEPPVAACLAGVVRGSFPSSIPKTDEERIQNLTNDWNVLKMFQWEVTEKMEGSSMTVGCVADDFIVCSRNLNLKEAEGNTLWTLARKYDLEAKMKALDLKEFVVQGEVLGENIQGNHYGLKGQDFYVFAMYDIGAGQYVSPNLRMKICESLGLKHAPVVSDNMTLSELNIADVLKLADGKSLINPNKLREGLVFKRVGGQEHFKAVSDIYLLKSGN